MSKRDDMRRELKELAKLAQAKRQEQTKSARSSGEWTYVETPPPAEAAAGPGETPAPGEIAAAAAPAPARTAGLEAPASGESVDPPSWPSNVTVPPVVPPGASQPAFPDAGSGPRKRSRVAVWASAGAAAAVLVGAGLIGHRMQASHAAAAAPSAAPPAVAQNTEVTPAAAPAAPLPAAEAPAETPPAAAAAPAAQAASPAPSVKPGRHLPAQPAAHPSRSTPKVAAPVIPKAAAPAAPHTDSLDDLMRKAVNSPAK